MEREIATQSSILAGGSHGQRILVGYSPRGHKGMDRTERLSTFGTSDTSAAAALGVLWAVLQKPELPSSFLRF